MNLKPEEISSVIREQMKKYDVQLEVKEAGTIIQVADGIARIYGLSGAMQGELLAFPGEVYGMVLNLEEDNVGAVLLGDAKNINEGDTVKATGRVAEVPVGDALLGRVVNALGQPIDDRGPVAAKRYRPIERVASGVIARKSVDTPLQTGIKAIDAMVPIGRGQRELIIGDRQTGKTAIALDTIINQRGQGVKCIYVAIGQKASTVASIVRILENHGAMEYTTVVASTASELAPLQFCIEKLILLYKVHDELLNKLVGVLVLCPVVRLYAVILKVLENRGGELAALCDDLGTRIILDTLRNLILCKSKQLLNQDILQVVVLCLVLFVDLCEQHLVLLLRLTGLDGA